MCNPYFLPSAQHKEKNANAPTLGKMATYPLPSRGSIVPTIGKKPGVAQIWGKWLGTPCLRGVHGAQQGEKMRIGPNVGKIAT